MAASKFVEILDTSDAPYSHENVSLDDVLDETRARSESSSGESRSSGSTSPERSTATTTTMKSHNPASTVKTRLRGFSMKKPKS